MELDRCLAQVCMLPVLVSSAYEARSCPSSAIRRGLSPGQCSQSRRCANQVVVRCHHGFSCQPPRPGKVLDRRVVCCCRVLLVLMLCGVLVVQVGIALVCQVKVFVCR